MAGLLEGGYWGDDTVKDQFGQTQADRREPVWAGLIQGGMGLLAGSQAMMPAERARYIAQAGQAYGGIPAAIRAGQSAAAQQTLQAQQIKAGQAKLDTAGRLAAMAKTPEFQAAVAKLEPHERMLLQAALDAGDMNNAQQILSGAGKAEIREREFALKQETAHAKLEAAKAKAEGKGAFGSSLPGIHAQNLQTGWKDPSTYEYYQAREFFSKPWKDAEGNTHSALEGLDKFPPSTYIETQEKLRAGGGAPAAPGAPGAPPVVAPAPAGTPAAPVPVVPPDQLPPFEVPGVPNPAPLPTPAPAVPAPPVVAAPPPPVPPKPKVVIPEGTPITDQVAHQVAADMDVDEERIVNGVEFYRDKQGRVEYDTGTARYRIDAPGKTPVLLPALKSDETREKALIKNNTTINKVDKALEHLQKNPNAWLGIAAMGPDWLLQRADPEGQPLRDLLRDLTGIEIHNRSGANVTASEEPRLDFLPKKGDTPEQIKQRLENMRQYVDEETRQAYLTGKREYKMPPAIKERYGKKPATPSKMPVKGDDGVWRPAP